MIKLFIPQSKGRVKTNARGFWYSKDTKKTYYDYLKVVNTSFIEPKQLEVLKAKYNQEAITYYDTALNCLVIYYNKDKKEILNYRSILEIKRQGKNTKLLRDYIKSALKLYGGLTIYINSHNYILESWHNKEV